jgi:hypothetical protein
MEFMSKTNPFNMALRYKKNETAKTSHAHRPRLQKQKMYLPQKKLASSNFY